MNGEKTIAYLKHRLLVCAEAEARPLQHALEAIRNMAYVGDVLDRWELLPGDVRGDLTNDFPEFVAAIEALIEAVEGE